MANFTEKAIIESLRELLEKYPIDKISVKQITDNCGISRNTFYYHFHDVYEVLTRYFIAQTEELIARYQEESSWTGCFVEGLYILYDNKKIIEHILKSISREQLEAFLNQIVYYHTRVIVDKEIRGKDYSERAISIAADFYKNALLGAVLGWIGGDMKDSPEDLARLYNSVFMGTIDPVLDSIERVI